LVQQDDEKFTESLLNNHQGLFVSEEVWAILKNGIQANLKYAANLLKTHTVRSWFVFLSEEAKKRVVIDMFKWVGKDKIKAGLLSLELTKRPYSEVFDDVLKEEIEDALNGSEGDESKEEASDAESDESKGEASEAESDDEDIDSESN
jgi:hypothetical protein